jgi:hypothetical protein
MYQAPQGPAGRGKPCSPYSSQLAPCFPVLSCAVVNDVVLAGYFDGKGTMVGLESATGIKRFEFHQRIDVSGTQVPAGGLKQTLPSLVIPSIGVWAAMGARLLQTRTGPDI